MTASDARVSADEENNVLQAEAREFLEVS